MFTINIKIIETSKIQIKSKYSNINNWNIKNKFKSKVNVNPILVKKFNYKCSFVALDLLVSNYYIESKAIHAFQSEIVTFSYTFKYSLLFI